MQFLNELFASEWFWIGLVVGLIPGIPSLIAVAFIIYDDRRYYFRKWYRK